MFLWFIFLEPERLPCVPTSVPSVSTSLEDRPWTPTGAPSPSLSRHKRAHTPPHRIPGDDDFEAGGFFSPTGCGPWARGRQTAASISRQSCRIQSCSWCARPSAHWGAPAHPCLGRERPLRTVIRTVIRTVFRGGCRPATAGNRRRRVDPGTTRNSSARRNAWMRPPLHRGLTPRFFQPLATRRLRPTGNFQPAPCIDRFLGGAIRPAKLRVHHRVDCGSDLGRLVPCVHSGASLPMDRGHVLPHGNSTTASIVATRAVAPGRIHHPRQPGGFPPSGKRALPGIPPPAWCGRLSRQP